MPLRRHDFRRLRRQRYAASRCRVIAATITPRHFFAAHSRIDRDYVTHYDECGCRVYMPPCHAGAANDVALLLPLKAMLCC